MEKIFAGKNHGNLKKIMESRKKIFPEKNHENLENKFRD